jgi:hypothetical protein
MSHDEAKAELRQALGDAQEMQARLRIVRASLPAAPEETDRKDLAAHPEGTSGLRIAIEGMLADQIEPLIKALRAALEIPG